MTKKEFISWIYPIAERASDISPVFVTAQAALESGWGKSAIGNNLFGITKGSSWNGAVQLVTTTEYFSRPNISFKLPEKVLQVQKLDNGRYKYIVKRLFRDYNSVEECLADHFRLLSKPMYADAYPYRKSPEEYVKRLVDGIGAKYATAPNYVDVMCQLFKEVRRIWEQLKQ